jgi:hypothetical protein
VSQSTKKLSERLFSGAELLPLGCLEQPTPMAATNT